ncbi:MAG: hypothetical protein QOJ65_2263, partial [Fimbriimonadaceae bacterium]|nr:hypothetical protein [Fimbriimonadaceae bacterium]
QLAKVKELIKKNRLVTLFGAGGTGKTRLSLQVGAELVEDFSDGVWVVNLVGLKDPELVAQGIAQALPISLKQREPFQAIVEDFREAHALFVIDNCEHLVKGVAAVVHKLLRSCAGLTVLATSRDQLGVAGEAIYEVPPMDYDLKGRSPDAEIVAGLESVELFRERASARLSGQDVLTSETAADIAELCKKLDGLPLALEQAAANLSYMSPGEILRRLGRHLGIPPNDVEGVDERHRTIQATIDWSYGMLSDAEKHLFKSLSIFSGGWTRDAAEHVCANEVVTPADVVPTLQQLVKRSMVLYLRGADRYRMLEPIREFAEAKRDPKTVPELRAKHFDWYLQVAKQAQEAGLEGNGGVHVQRLSDDEENVRSALTWGFAQPRCGETVLEFCLSMYPFWLAKGYLREGAAWMQRAMDAAEAMPDKLRAAALNSLGVLMWQQGLLEPAKAAVQASQELWLSIGDRAKVAATRSNLAGIAFMKGDVQEAVDEFRPAVEILRDLGDERRLAPALSNLGVAESMLGNLAQAAAFLQEAVDIYRKLKNRGGAAKAFDSLLGIYDAQGTLLEHMDLFLEASELVEADQDDLTLENLLEVGARACLQTGESQLAAQAIGAMELLLEQSGRQVPLSQQQKRAEIAESVQAALGYSAFKRACREGRQIGAHAMLGFLRQHFMGDS